MVTLRTLLGIAICLAIVSPVLAQDRQVIWSEDFEDTESFWEDWHTDGPFWKVAPPATGTTQVPSGTNVAGVGNKAKTSSATRLIRHKSFTVPGTDQNPRLQFRHWFSLPRTRVTAQAPTDNAATGAVYVKERGGDRVRISPVYSGVGGLWSTTRLALSEYSGKKIELSFELTEGQTTGWFIDDLELIVGDYARPFPETFETGIGDWYAENGVWDIRSFSGENSGIGTSATSESPSSKFISPSFVVPDASQNPRLRFWHWFDFSVSGNLGSLSIRRNSDVWQPVGHRFEGSSIAWTPYSLDLSRYSGEEIQLALNFRSLTQAGNTRLGLGWFVDNFELQTGPYTTAVSENFDNGYGDWFFTGGIWEIGEPRGNNNHPVSQSGKGVLATRLDGGYRSNFKSDAISPPFTLPSASSQPRLRFQTWHQFGEADFGLLYWRQSDPLTGQISWTKLSDSGEFTGKSESWTRTSFSLADIAGQTGRFVFRAKAVGTDSLLGWYIDDLEIETGAQSIKNPEGFENGIGDWIVQGGSWEAGKPVAGPRQAFAGTSAVGTKLDGHYPSQANATLVSPPFRVPKSSSSPALRYWHWYEFGAGDLGRIELILENADRITIAGPFTDSSFGEWINGFVSLADYTGQTVQLAFVLISNLAQEGNGWFIDNIRMQTNILQDINNFEITEGDTINFLLDQLAGGLEYDLELLDAQWDATPTGNPSPPLAEGATIQSQLGVFAWNTSEINGPAEYDFRAAIFDPLSSWNPIDFEDFEITVKERRSAPEFQNDSNTLIFQPGQIIRHPLRASDQDFPLQTITHTLDQSPEGAVVDPNSGLVVWVPTPEQATQAHTFIVRATDDGDPPLSTTSTLNAIPSSLAGPQPLSPITKDGSVQIDYENIELNTTYTFLGSDSANPDLSTWTVIDTFQWTEAPFRITVPSQNAEQQFFILKKE